MVGAFMISPIVHTATVTAKRIAEDPARAVSPKPQPVSSALATSRPVRLRPSIIRVIGICSSTMSTPLRPITRPYCVAEMPACPMSTASVVLPCWATRASSRVSATTAMKRASRNTVPRLTAGSSWRAAGVSGLVSGILTKITTAQSSVVSASSRKSVR